MEILDIGVKHEERRFSGGPLDGKTMTSRDGHPSNIWVRVEAIIDYYDGAGSTQRHTTPVPLGTTQYEWRDEHDRYCVRPPQETTEEEL